MWISARIIIKKHGLFPRPIYVSIRTFQFFFHGKPIPILQRDSNTKIQQFVSCVRNAFIHMYVQIQHARAVQYCMYKCTWKFWKCYFMKNPRGPLGAVLSLMASLRYFTYIYKKMLHIFVLSF